MLQWVVSGIVMVGVLVVIHELGHFLVARLFGVGTPVFSVGMGPRLFGFRLWDTDFRVSLLPIGGYVQMAGADPFGEEDPDAFVDPKTDFMRKPVWQRLLIMLAGPGMNLALPFVLFTAVLMLGEPQADNSIGTVIPGTPAEQAGLRPGDRVIEAAGVEVDVWPDLVRVLDDHLDREVPLVVDRAGHALSLTLPAGSVVLTPDGLVDTEKMGLWQSRPSSRIGVSDPTSPAWRAGLRPGDAIVEVDGVALTTFAELQAALAEEREHTLTRLRVTDGQLARDTVTLVPDPAWAPAEGEVQPDRWGIVHLSLFVGRLLEGSGAEEAGVKPGDRIVAIDGTRIRSWSDVLGLVGRTVGENEPDAEARPLRLELVRDGAPLTLDFKPKMRRELVRGMVTFRPVMGVQQFEEIYVDGPSVSKFYTPVEAAGRAVEEGSLAFRGTMSVLGNLVVGKIKPQESLGGPLEIFRAAGESAEAGIFTFVRTMGMISFSLGIINLLPVPVLDGGQIVFYAIEGIRGRPLPLSLRERIQMVGVLALFALILMVTVMDVSRWLAG